MNLFYSQRVMTVFCVIMLVFSLGFMGSTQADETAEQAKILKANEAFYQAFRSSNYTAMDELWARKTPVSVIHPRWPGVTGRKNVMATWHNIMIKGKPPQVKAVSPTVIITGKTAYVLCYEDLGGAIMVATNIFTLENGAWRMIHHHASQTPVLTAPKGQPT